MKTRTVAKAIAWESISTAATLGLAFAMFGNIGSCILFSVIAYLMKLVLFYFHDRIWEAR